MIKTVIKEFIIFLLLLVSIALLLGILFYDYIPTTKMVPSKIQTQILPKEIQDELSSQISQGNNNTGITVPPYSIDSIDLRNYENTKQYDKGKINPFEKYVEPEVSTPNNNTGSNSTSTNTNTNNTGNGGSNSTSNTNTNSNNNVGNFYEGK